MTSNAWMGVRSGAAEFMDLSDDLALLAVQGPEAVALVSSMTADDVSEVRPFHFKDTDIAGVHAGVSRTGYTGEDGFELYVDSPDAVRLWDALLEAGAPKGLIPCGLGARDTLRFIRETISFATLRDCSTQAPTDGPRR